MWTQLGHWLNNCKLQRKFLLINVLATLLTTLFGAALISWAAWHEVRQQAELDALTRARVIAESSAAGLAFLDNQALDSTLSALRTDRDVTSAAIYDASGKRFHMLALPVTAPEFAPRQLPPEGLVLEQRAHIEIWVPVILDGKAFGALLIRESLAGLYSQIATLLGIILAGSLLAAALSALLVHRLLPHVLAPLRELSQLMHRVSSAGDYSSRATTSRHDEVGELAESFNRMIDRIERNNQTLTEELQQRREVESKLDRLAHYDNVTQLTNRHYFEHNLRQLLREVHMKGSRAALLFVDLDNFKDVNDSYGHHIGDALLRKVAERMRQSLRAGDEISRLGGDEFALILPQVGEAAQVGRVAEKILHALTLPINIEGREIFVGVSMGSVMLPDDTDEFHSALRFADMAMYHAKHRGKNNHQSYSRELSEEQGQRLALESDLRRALERNELEMYFQPIWQLGDIPRLLGAEALMRWHHPTRGMVPPADFIPLAEETGLIVQIGEWALQSACMETASWQTSSSGAGLFVAVNLSPRQLGDSHILRRVETALEMSGLPPQLLELELTESILADQSSQSVQVLMRIAELGIPLVLDDFGTGYSSLSYLKHFPISKLKIDRGFVMELPDNPDDKSICEAVIGLGKSLGVTVLAEGIESSEQADMLARMGCRQAQGYFFSRPIPAAAFRQLIGMA